MKRGRWITIAALVAIVFACSEQAGQMLIDAGDMMQPDAGAQDTPVECNKSDTIPGTDVERRWAEFPISSPGRTEVTVCYAARPELAGPYARASCNRLIAPWYGGTNTGVLPSCDNVTSITVHD